MLRISLPTCRGNSSEWDFASTIPSSTEFSLATKRSFSRASFSMAPEAFAFSARGADQDLSHPGRQAPGAHRTRTLRLTQGHPRTGGIVPGQSRKEGRQVSFEQAPRWARRPRRYPSSRERKPRGFRCDLSVGVSSNDAAKGAILEVELPHFEGGKHVSVHIPPGVKSGTKLRLKQMGQLLPNHPSSRGDLYLHLQVA